MDLNSAFDNANLKEFKELLEENRVLRERLKTLEDELKQLKTMKEGE